MSGLLIIGAGGHGRVVADAASSEYGKIAFLDDAPDFTESGHWPVIGAVGDLESYRDEFDKAFAAIGNNRQRLSQIGRLIAAGFTVVSIAHPLAAVSESVTIGQGSVIMAQAAVNFGSSLGQGCIVNTGASVDHDCRLGDGVHVSPGARLAGKVTVGARAWVGIGAVVREGISIGPDAIVGAGAAVVGDVPASTTVVGVPAVSV